MLIKIIVIMYIFLVPLKAISQNPEVVKNETPIKKQVIVKDNSLTEKFFEIRIKPCNKELKNSIFKKPNHYHAVTFDINFKNETHKYPINKFKICRTGNNINFVKTSNINNLVK